LFNKIGKKLSEEDLKNWDKLKKTLDFKFYNKQYHFKELKRNNKQIKKQHTIDNYTLIQNKNLKNSIVDKKYLNKYQLQDIRIDKKKLTLLKKGKIKPERVLDLHGLTSVDAKKKAIEFTKLNFDLGFKLLLIITGKGKITLNDFNKEHRNGVLRKSLKTWLYESDLRPNILGIISSHISHGGEGAFYVYLKNNKIL
tara:strand:+ start:61 stop:651 length:591 start_codon:yes stop_codon:yes gene_type:complete